MNTRAKGNRVRRLALSTLEADGWTAGIVERTGKFIKIKDLFGLFDIVGVRKGRVLFLQITTNKPHSHKLYHQFVKDNEISMPISVEQWVWMDRVGFKKWQYTL